MQKEALPSVSDITAENADTLIGSDKLVLLGFFNEKQSNGTFSAVAELNKFDATFGASSDAKLAKAHGVTSLPGVAVYKPGEEREIYDGSFEEGALNKFVQFASLPVVGEIGPETHMKYMQSGLPLAFIFVENDDVKSKFTKELEPIARLYKGKVNFATIDAVAFGRHADNLNLKQEWPAFAIQNPVTNAKYPFDQTKELTSKGIGEFVKDFIAGKIVANIKSDPIPESQPDAVHTLVGKTFNETTTGSKDVLVMFHAPWCGHCKNMAPTYELLGSHYKAKNLNDKVLIAKIDATTNDVPENIQGFPTLKVRLWCVHFQQAANLTS